MTIKEKRKNINEHCKKQKVCNQCILFSFTPCKSANKDEVNKMDKIIKVGRIT